MKKLTIFRELLLYSWKNHKPLMFVIVFENIFTAALPLINVIGIGVIINALTSGYGKKKVMSVILLFVGLNLSISLVKYIFTYLDNLTTRKASDKIQTDYIRDGVIVNYHWAQDGSVLHPRI
jgi:ABC-type multidrug transport system fused ATPase/permease subunit